MKTRPKKRPLDPRTRLRIEAETFVRDSYSMPLADSNIDWMNMKQIKESLRLFRQAKRSLKAAEDSVLFVKLPDFMSK